jgi:hypothetical protein
MVALAFFSSRVASSTKQLMVAAVVNPVKESNSKQLETDRLTFQTGQSLEQFATTFLKKHPVAWQQDDQFISVRPTNTVQDLDFVNDCAEHGNSIRIVSTSTECRDKEMHKLMDNEQQLQFLLQLVTDSRQFFNCKQEITDCKY